MSFGFNFFDDSTEMVVDSNESSWYSDLLEGSSRADASAVLVSQIDLEKEAQDDGSFDIITIDSTQFLRYLDLNRSKFHEHTDLIPGVYEGGYKIWECTIDVIKFLNRSNHFQKRLENAAVLDLGCGHGFLGIHAILQNARFVGFSDFNADVIAGPTTRNIIKNCFGTKSTAVAYAGDWLNLHHYFVESNFGRFDVILTAETIYNESCCRKVVFIINELLSENGFALLATKRFYFGVGGGSATLEEYTLQLPGLQLEKVWSIEDGASNIRDLYLLTKSLVR